jgi:integrase
MASVYKHRWTYKGVEKEVWRVVCTDARGKRPVKSFHKKKDADAYRLRVEREIEQGTHVPARCTVTLAYAIDQYLKECERRWKERATRADKLSGYTLVNYTTSANRHVLPALGATKLTDLTTRRMQKFIDEQAKNFAPKTLETMGVVLSQTLKFAFDEGWIGRNPLVEGKGLRLPTGYKNPRDIPSEEEIERIVDGASTWRKFEQPAAHWIRVAIVQLALFAGLRPGEISGLQWQDIDFHKDLIYVRHAYSSKDGLKSTKSGRERTVAMAPRVREALLRLAEIAPGSGGFVFSGKHGNPILPHHIGYAYLKPVMRSAGLLKENGACKYSMRLMRASASTRWMEAGMPLELNSKQMGHSTTSMTADIYIRPSAEAARKFVVKAAAPFGAGPETASSDDTFAVAEFQRPAAAIKAGSEASRQSQDSAFSGYATGTQRAYRTDWEDWSAWCARNGQCALPAAPEAVRVYVAELARDHRASTLMRRVTGIAYMHKMAGYVFDRALADVTQPKLIALSAAVAPTARARQGCDMTQASH